MSGIRQGLTNIFAEIPSFVGVAAMTVGVDFRRDWYTEIFVNPAKCGRLLKRALQLMTTDQLASINDNELQRVTNVFLSLSKGASTRRVDSPPLYNLFARSTWFINTHQIPYYQCSKDVAPVKQGYISVSSDAAIIYQRLRDEWLNRGARMISKENTNNRLDFYTKTFTQDTTETRRWFARPELWLVGAAVGIAAYLIGLPALAIAGVALVGFAVAWLAFRGLSKVKHAVERKYGAVCVFKSHMKKSPAPIQPELLVEAHGDL